ncbi:MAG: DNA mismatch repair endonuclease MutL [Planctomycetaceae bacterium]|nr:DNA mismatch repair endonuclease MutL [Planctomycetaceae bacterium]
MPTIRQLPPSVVNKIAAGEVIERPASVVKELLENSVDAGATRIDVSLGQGGTDLIRVLDDGCGITSSDLPLAVASHATSKITSADDLFRVGTFGFRGEALASIGEVSHLVIRSRERGADAGYEIEVDGGRRSEIAPCGCPIGTAIEVRNLFFNTPVRRKFLRASQTEIGHASEAFTRLALAHPRVHFTLRHNERLLFDLPPVANWRERIGAFFGRDLESSLIPIENSDGEVRIHGFVADPQHSRGNNRMQYLFLNGRHIRDRALQHALGEAYRGLLLSGRFPIGFLRLEMPAEAVDVNVHPTKLEVRFADSGRIYSLLLGTIRKKFLATDLTARVQAPLGAAEPGAEAADSEAVARHRRELVNWAKGALAPAAGTAVADEEQSPQSLLELQFDRPSGPLELTRLDRAWEPAPTSPRLEQAGEAAGRLAGHPLVERTAPARIDPPQPTSRSHLGFQIHNRYLVTENADGMVVIDQHALHERILYEQLREKVLAGDMETQRLLVPEPVSLAPAEAAAALEAKDVLGQLGIEVEPFGGDTVLVSSYPAMLANLAPAEMLRQVIEQIVTSSKTPNRRDLVDELLHMIACKAAIKAGDRLAPEEVTALLEQRHHYQDSHHCPHGRPTALVFTREELDRRFKRT